MDDKEFWYSVVEHGDTRFVCRGRYHLPRPVEAKDAAEEAAEDYHGNHDGWESRWPLTIALYQAEDGPELHRFTVERESEPVFYAYRVSPQSVDAVDPHVGSTPV